jgi:hypothetical protein
LKICISRENESIYLSKKELGMYNFFRLGCSLKYTIYCKQCSPVDTLSPTSRRPGMLHTRCSSSTPLNSACVYLAVFLLVHSLSPPQSVYIFFWGSRVPWSVYTASVYTCIHSRAVFHLAPLYFRSR